MRTSTSTLLLLSTLASVASVHAFIQVPPIGASRRSVVVREYNKEGPEATAGSGDGEGSGLGGGAAEGDASDEVSMVFRRRTGSRVVLEGGGMAAAGGASGEGGDPQIVRPARSLAEVPVFLVSPSRVLVPGARRSIHCYDTSLLGALEAARESGGMVSQW
mmetsp:Transcript_72766/g.207281  ORF Transcript_72766/g.207281 Transcript_72766/m.207281 type:complete len:161 (-) Transcript_72766:41-523(-)